SPFIDAIVFTNLNLSVPIKTNRKVFKNSCPNRSIANCFAFPSLKLKHILNHDKRPTNLMTF
ncbi:hypothetical protein PIB30_104104, partial [Stylosanthes scabra]|nr:hypothetical protein [Stylosanthes scabra]